MPFTSIHALTAGIAELLKGTGLFKSVVISDGTDGGHLLDELEGLAVPSAVVGYGGSDYRDRGTTRTMRALVVVTDVFRRGGMRRHEGVWSLAEAAEALFTPELANGAPGHRVLSGVEVRVASTEALSGAGPLAAVLLVLEAEDYI